MRVGIIGAGIVGVATAHALLDEGHEVDLIDREGIAAGTSAGNAGWIAHLDILPLASPKVWRNLPRWAFDPLGPLAIRPAYLPALMPWLARFVAASSPARIEASVWAIAALNSRALPAWERRLEALGLSQHLRRKGLLSVWSDARAYRAAGSLFEGQRALGIPVETLDASALHALEPGLGPHAVAGALYPSGCHVSDPLDFTRALGEAALARGAHLRRFEIVGLGRHGGEVAVRTTFDTLALYDRIVIAAGAWSKPLAASLGDTIPLDTERGYNVTLPSGRLGLSRPILFEGEGFVTTPLDTGDRVGGSVEFAGLEAAPNFKRVDAILGRLRRFLPDADLAGGTRWMGFRPSIPDSLPVIGCATGDPQVVYAFGHAHHGLTQAAATADIVAALIAEREPGIPLDPYSPERFSRRY